MEKMLDGRRIVDEPTFHEEMASLLDFGPFYGRNLDALWDRLSADVERPITLVWLNSSTSRQNLGSVFDRIVDILGRVKDQNTDWGLAEKFDYRLE